MLVADAKRCALPGVRVGHGNAQVFSVKSDKDHKAAIHPSFEVSRGKSKRRGCNTAQVAAINDENAVCFGNADAIDIGQVGAIGRGVVEHGLDGVVVAGTVDQCGRGHIGRDGLHVGKLLHGVGGGVVDGVGGVASKGKTCEGHEQAEKEVFHNTKIVRLKIGGGFGLAAAPFIGSL